MDKKVYYDYMDRKLVPIWMILSFSSGEINWDIDTYYVPIAAPFEVFMAEDFYEDEKALSLRLNELVINPYDYPNHIGMNLKLIKKWCSFLDTNCGDVTKFIINFWDLEELLTYDAFRVVKEIPEHLRLEQKVIS